MLLKLRGKEEEKEVWVFFTVARDKKGFFLLVIAVGECPRPCVGPVKLSIASF